MNYPKVGIVYLSYHSESYWDDVVSALRKMTYPKERVELIVVDNPHPEFGSSMPYIRDRIVPLSGTDVPRVTTLPQETNTGYAKGNNMGIIKALELGCDYVCLHNDDGFMDPECLSKLVEAAEADNTIGALQPLVMLYPETNKVNSAGNRYHYLGFGGTQDYGVPKEQLHVQPVQKISYASFACALIRADRLRDVGMLDEDLFMYHEDLEYSLRLKLAGYTVALVKDALFYHKYQFSRSTLKFYYMERNRYAVLLMYYHWLTLVLLLPIGIVMEIGLWLFFIMQGWFKERVSVYGYWLQPKHWSLWLGKRTHIQKLRQLSDKQFLADAVSTVQFGEKKINSPLITYVANPLLAGYWSIIKNFIV